MGASTAYHIIRDSIVL
uniref:Uncharacterized protein n=1 Tax=Arundo donax TaxID=35708 RepID=A0A0A9BX75_ARUDO